MQPDFRTDLKLLLSLFIFLFIKKAQGSAYPLFKDKQQMRLSGMRSHERNYDTNVADKICITMYSLFFYICLIAYMVKQKLKSRDVHSKMMNTILVIIHIITTFAG